ncbi:hypothetical protein JW877_07830 [bacterium]|nr:hypothetical protein [bacterium]
MKRALIVFVLLGMIATLCAQDDFGIPSVYPKEIKDVCNSAAVGGGTFFFNFDAVDTMNDPEDILPATSSKVLYSTNNQTSYSSQNMSIIGGSGYESTYQTSITLPATGTVYYYYQLGTDSTFSSLLPKNTAETFPPGNNLLANIHDDPAGDYTHMVIGGVSQNWNNVDLRNFKFGYSNNKIYVQITSNGGFATSHTGIKQHECGWLDKEVDVFHIYGVPLINPASENNDSVFFAVLYADVYINYLIYVIDIGAGVYKITTPGEDAGIEEYLDAYECISSPSTFGTNINGDVLNMWFTKSLLTSDPDFGPLPDDNSIVTGCGIASAYVGYKSCESLVPDTFAYAVHDFSKNTVVYLDTPQKTIGTNSAPTFTAHSHPYTMPAEIAYVTFLVTYDDNDNNQPTQRQITIEGVGTFDMSTNDHIYNDGAEFSYERNFTNPSIIRYTYTFSDGQHTINLSDSILFDFLSFNTSADTFEIYDLNFGNTYTMDAREDDQPFVLTNNGTVPLDWGLSIIFIEDPWGSGYSPDTNQFVIRARFNTSDEEPGEFVPLDDYITDVTKWADLSIFGPNGYNIPAAGEPSNWNSLWLQFIAPTISTVYGPGNIQEIRLNLVAREHMP